MNTHATFPHDIGIYPVSTSQKPLTISEVQPVYDFVVLGRGPAGIAAADTLSRYSDKKMLCLESRERDGGNTHTNAKGDDEGAMWFHTTKEGLDNYTLTRKQHDLLADIDYLFISRVKEMGFSLVEDTQHAAIFFNGAPVEQEKYFKYLKDAHKHIKEYIRKNGDTNVAEALKDFNKTPLDTFFMQCEFGPEISGLDPHDASASHAVEHMPCAAGVIVKEGLGNFIKKLGGGTVNKTLYNAGITAIYTDDSPYTIVKFKAADDKIHTVRAKHVINTIPPTVFTIPPTVFEEQGIEEQGIIHKGIIHNFPAEKMEAAKKLPRGQMNKIIIPLSEGYLEDKHIKNNTHLQIGVENGGNIFFLARPLGKDQLVALIGGEASVRLDGLPDGEREKQAIAHALNYLHTVPLFQDIEQHIKKSEVILTKWSSDPCSRGSYLNSKPGAREARATWAAPIGDKVFFAGESTPSGRFDGLQTHVAGALMTGFAAASDAIHAARDGHHHVFAAGQRRNHAPRSR
ncbi:MAG: hypothetical protein EBR02_09320 [Alphaproteobacteria bacterium]|nr:hypothetical protein [Alphaproteobacteria bacterium]